MENGLHEIIRTRMALRNPFFFDLLPANVNNTFRVDFDIYTPRPHFIILPKIRGIPSDFSALNDEQRSSLIRATHSVLNEFNICKGILSIHRGQWKSAVTRVFHAHICVDTEEYLSVFNNQTPAQLEGWQNPQAYQDGVLGYATSAGRTRLFEEDVNEIGQLINFNNAQHMENIQVPSLLPEGVRLMCHPRKPLIGFFARINGRRIQDLLRNVLEAMEEFAQTHGMVEKTDTRIPDRRIPDRRIPDKRIPDRQIPDKRIDELIWF